MVDEAGLDRGATWKGKAVELLVAAHAMLATDGKLNVSVPLVDDAGVDLVFNVRGSPATLAVQVKARFATTTRVAKDGIFGTQIRRKALQPRADLAVMFVLFDNAAEHDITHVWLVPSIDFASLTAEQSPGRSTLSFVVSIAGKKNQWSKYHCDKGTFPSRIVEMLMAQGATKPT